MGIVLAVFLMVGIALASPRIVVEEGWVRVVPPVSKMSAAFMVIRNEGDESDYLVGARSEVAKVVEIHRTFMEDGVMKMRKLERVPVPAGGSVELKPGGIHVMLIGLKKTLKSGQTVEITLIFKKSGEVSIEVPVR